MRLETTSPATPGPPPADVLLRGAAVREPAAGRRDGGPQRPVQDARPGTAARRRPIVRRIETEAVSPLRRRQRVKLWRKPRFWQRTKRLAGLLAVAAVPAATIVWLLTSERFALSDLTVAIGDPAPLPGEIRGAGAPPPPSRVDDAWVRQQLAPFLGHNLLRLSLAAVAEPIERHPWVRAVDVGKELPAGLRVRVALRREAALLRQDGGGPSLRGPSLRGPSLRGPSLRGPSLRLSYLDGEGRPIAPLDAAEAAAAIAAGELAVVRRRTPPATPETDDLGAALDLLRELEAAAPRWRPSAIEILGENDFKVITTGLPFPLLVEAGTLEARIRRLEDHLPQLEEQLLGRYGAAAVIDLRFERRIIVEPSPPEPAAAKPAAPGGTQQKGGSG